MSISSNSDGKTATRKSTGVTGGAGDGRAVTARQPFLAQPVAKSSPRMPFQNKPVTGKGVGRR